MVPVWEQFQSFAFTIAIGVVLGIMVDGYRGLYRLWRPRALITILGDLLLWLLLTGLVFFLLLLNNWGEVRAYVFIGMVAGVLIYRKWLGTWVIRFWHKFFVAIGRIYRLLLMILLLPFKLIQKILFLPLGLISMLLDWVWRLMVVLGRKVGIRPGQWFYSLQKWWRNRHG